MRKKSTYLYFLALIVILVAAAYALNIHFIKSAAHGIIHSAANPWIFASAAVCAFIFMGSKRYWLINIGCALIAALVIELLIKGHHLGLYSLTICALAFLSVVYLLNLIKVVFTK